VRYPACQLTEGIEFLGLKQLAFERALGGDIGDRTDPGVPADTNRLLEEIARRRGIERPAVADRGLISVVGLARIFARDIFPIATSKL